MLTLQQIKQYEDDGMLFLPEYFSEEKIDILRMEFLRLPKNAPGTILENDNQTIRALHGCHAYSQTFWNLIRHPCILKPVQQILKEAVYLYQFKINMKAAFSGDAWPWHQDYVFWNQEDGLPSPDVVSVIIFLDNVNHFNGPLYLIPGSHQEGLIDVQPQMLIDGNEDSNWEVNFSANLKYCLQHTTVARMVEKGGIVAPVGSRGSILFFHGNIAHASVSNISPYNRRLILITYSSVKNIPNINGEPRPEFLVSRDYTPLEPINDDALLELTTV